MSEPRGGTFRSVLHPTDLSPASDLAFAHALKIAVFNRAALTILHATSKRPEAIRWADFPRVRETLTRWGLLPEGADREAVLKELGVRVRKVAGHDSTLKSISDYVIENPVDMLVLATEGRGGMPRFLRPSTAEPIARRTGVATLFVPEGSRGIVDPEVGSVMLENILIPVDQHPDPYAATLAAMRAASRYGVQAKLTLLYVGEEASFPSVELPETDEWVWERRAVDGPVVRTILDTAEEIDARLIVMVTEGRNGFLDVLRGSTTEQVLRGADCPVLAVPEL